MHHRDADIVCVIINPIDYFKTWENHQEMWIMLYFIQIRQMKRTILFIVYDIVFHIERKINYFILFLIFIFVDNLRYLAASIWISRFPLSILPPDPLATNSQGVSSLNSKIMRLQREYERNNHGLGERLSEVFCAFCILCSTLLHLTEQDSGFW